MPDRSFTVSFETDIPRLVGLSGSSAIVIAMSAALMRFYDVEIPLARAADAGVVGREGGAGDLRRHAGPRDPDVRGDRVHGLRPQLWERGYGIYERLEPPKLPPLYVAYDPERAEVSDVPHRNLRELFNRGDPAVVAAMQKYRDLTDRGPRRADEGRCGRSGKMNEDFDLRKTIMTIAAGEPADGGGGADGRREREVCRQRRRDLRAVQGRPAIPAARGRARPHAVHGHPADAD